MCQRHQQDERDSMIERFQWPLHGPLSVCQNIFINALRRHNKNSMLLLLLLQAVL